MRRLKMWCVLLVLALVGTAGASAGGKWEKIPLPPDDGLYLISMEKEGATIFIAVLRAEGKTELEMWGCCECITPQITTPPSTQITPTTSTPITPTPSSPQITPTPLTPTPREKGNNGVGNGEDPQPPGNPPQNDTGGAAPGAPNCAHGGCRRGGKP